jgi:SAM-dependent methyltransferase
MLREASTCGECGSTVRFRAVVAAFDEQVLKGAPRRPELRGIGFSDPDTYARRLAQSTTYYNSWYHLSGEDLTDLGTFRGQRYDFVVCSEVMEHVDRPVETSFSTLFELLRPGGVLIMTTPTYEGAATVEHFPPLTHYEVINQAGSWVLRGTAADSVPYEARGLTFHGGEGATLEMRLYAAGDIQRHLDHAGFQSVEEQNLDRPNLGILWSATSEVTHSPAPGLVGGGHSGVWVAQRPTTTVSSPG